MALRVTAKATQPQAALANSTALYPAMVAGFGAGKTQALMMRALRLKLQYPNQDLAYYLPTYDLVRRIGYPRFSELFAQARIPNMINKQDHVLHVYGCGQIIFRTLDTPERIVGFEVADSLVDELDTLKKDNAQHCWRQILARNRQKKPDGSSNTVAVGTTPEGFRFVYENWKKNPVPGGELIHAPTESNQRNLPKDYIDNLRAQYPAHLIQAYLYGQFVNLTSGSVYPDFDRVLNGTTETIQDKETVHIGMDFNVYHMAARVFVVREGLPLLLAELSDIRDTPAMVDAIKQRYAGRAINVYPDASGQSTSSKSASVSDLAILRAGGFNVVVGSTNPTVKDRIASVSGLICNAQGDRRLKVNAKECPKSVEDLEQQVYDGNGDPDKKSGHDHGNDALGYFLHSKWPIQHNKVKHLKLGQG